MYAPPAKVEVLQSKTDGDKTDGDRRNVYQVYFVPVAPMPTEPFVPRPSATRAMRAIAPLAPVSPRFPCPSIQLTSLRVPCARHCGHTRRVFLCVQNSTICSSDRPLVSGTSSNVPKNPNRAVKLKHQNVPSLPKYFCIRGKA